MSTWWFIGVKRGWSVTAIYKPIIQTTCDPRYLTTIQASTAYCRDSVTFFVCVVFIVCNVSYCLCSFMYCVLFELGVLLCVLSHCSITATGYKPICSSININNNNNNNIVSDFQTTNGIRERILYDFSFRREFLWNSGPAACNRKYPKM
jgi:hypothetical protein